MAEGRGQKAEISKKKYQERASLRQCTGLTLFLILILNTYLSLAPVPLYLLLPSAICLLPYLSLAPDPLPLIILNTSDRQSVQLLRSVLLES
jgi:hypothetical protein